MYRYNPPHIEMVKTMNFISSMIFIVIGIFLIFYGLIYIFIFIGIIPILIGIIDIISAIKVLKIKDFLAKKEYEKSKSLTLQYLVLGFIFGLVLPGIFLLISYSKYDDIIKYHNNYIKNIKNYD
ncbi:MAG: hypothetical protein ACP5JT_02360 [Thermoplasmata archaeon]